jgi:transcriptional regulator with PAS, ATPase and Fis domain
MFNNFSETGSLELFARYDFLDVCLLGETGTGKTHLAQLIHDSSPRRDKPFVAVNCAELAPSLIESELFGYEKGAFTGAHQAKTGKFEAASGGTIFLDEIGELSSEIQAKLLKVVEEKRVVRVGSTRARPVDVRVICATHRDLSVLREDLRYRVAARTIRLKPLRERRGEILPLARAFLADFSRKSMQQVAANEKVLRLLEGGEWRGNVRELRSFVENACLAALFDGNRLNAPEEKNAAIELTAELILSQLTKLREAEKTRGDFKCAGNLAPPIMETGIGLRLVAGNGSYKQTVEEFDRDLIKKTLAENNQNVSRAAVKLGLSRYGLIKKIKRYGIKVADDGSERGDEG